MVEWTEGTPSLDQAAERLGLCASDFDADFGVALVDPQKHLFAVRGISSRAAAHGGAASDPPISTFGPE